MDQKSFKITWSVTTSILFSPNQHPEPYSPGLQQVCPSTSKQTLSHEYCNLPSTPLVYNQQPNYIMGGCAIPSQKSVGAEFRGDTEPEDTHSLRGLNLHQRHFNVKISNIKLKNIPYDYVSLTLVMSNFPEMRFEKRKVEEGVVRWNDKPQKLQLKCDEYQLRKEWLTIGLEYMDVKMSEIRLNLYRIASGPAHLTFPLVLTSRIECRLSMDVHFSEWVNISIQTLQAEVMLDQNRPEELFNYTIRAITRSEKDQEESQPSYPQKEVAHQIEGKERKSNAEDDNKLIWLHSKDISLPRIQRRVNAIELPQSSIQFMLWECNDLEIEEDDVLTGECYISLGKGAYHDPVEAIRLGRPTLVYKIRVNQKLWLCGKCIGQAKLDIVIEIDQFIKQNLLLVRTQNGLQLSTPVFDTTKQRVECPQIIEISKLQKLIEQGFGKMLGFKRSDSLKIQDVRVKVIANMIKLLSILQSSKKESMKFYIYKSQKDLINGQEELLNIGIKMLSRLEQQQNLLLKENCWKILIALIQRGELSLRHAGFNAQEKEEIAQGNPNKLLREKIEFSIKYQEYLYNALKSALRSMESKNLQAIQRKFVEFYCAFCYLRIPQFREQLLTAITHQNDGVIEEWRGTQVYLEDQAAIQQRRKTDPQLSYMYDWQSNFYDIIIIDPRSKQNIQELKEILSITQWRERMEKRGVAFFLFVVYWVQYIQIAAIISQNVKWYILPGYNKLVKAILCQLSKRSIVRYPDSLKEVTTKMLANQKLLNVFVAIILKGMNLMEYTSVIAGLEMISGYFKYLSETKRKIPTTFNYSNFLTSLKTIITHQHSFSAAVCLKLIYDHYNMFAPEFRREMSLFLLGKIFFRLFLSWSFNIRVVFHHLLLFRLVMLSNRLPVEKRALQYGINSEVKKKYLILMNIVENIKIRKEEDQCNNFRVNYQKEYFKKMRKKLQEGRKMTTTVSNVIDRTLKKKNTIKESKYSVKELSRPTETLRAHSEVIENVHVNYSRKHDEDKETYSYMADQSEDSSQTEQQLKIRKKIQPENEISDLPMELLEYTKQALAEFRDVEEKFDKFYSGNVDSNVVPALAIKIPTDEGEFRTIEKEDW